MVLAGDLVSERPATIPVKIRRRPLPDRLEGFGFDLDEVRQWAVAEERERWAEIAAAAQETSEKLLGRLLTDIELTRITDELMRMFMEGYE